MGKLERKDMPDYRKTTLHDYLDKLHEWDKEIDMYKHAGGT